MKVTIKHVAQAAKVSHTTVSRVLHNDPRISESTCQRVMEAVRKLNYRPNIMARGLVKRQTFLIGMVVPNIVSSFFPEIIQGIEEITNEKGYSIILCTSEDDAEREKSHVLSLLNKGVDGLIISGTQIPENDKMISHDNKKVVYLARKIPDTNGIFVGVDDTQIGYMATEYLITSGHQRIAHLTGNPEFLITRQRRQGYENAFKKHGIGLDESIIIPSGFTIEKGYGSAQHLLKHSPLPSAVYAVSDFTAIGAMQAFREAGLNIPEDMAIVGTDDLLLASLVDPPLTTVSQPKRQMGITAARMLIDAIEGKKVESIELETKLVIRNSCNPKT